MTLKRKIKHENSNLEKLHPSLHNHSKLEALNCEYERLQEREAGVIKVKMFSNIS